MSVSGVEGDMTAEMPTLLWMDQRIYITVRIRCLHWARWSMLLLQKKKWFLEWMPVVLLPSGRLGHMGPVLLLQDL